MPQEGPVSKRGDSDSEAAWGVLGYLVSGLLAWGGIGAIADHFLKTSIFFPIGLALGSVLGLYLVWVRYGKAELVFIC